MTTLQIIDSVVRPRHWGGVDWGAETFVLARSGDREVWWRGGHNYWSGVGMPAAYASAELTLVDMSVRYPYARKTLQEGGRLSYKTLQTHREVIDAWLRTDVSAAGRIHPKRKYTVEVLP